MSLAAAIDSLASDRNLTVIRRAAGTFNIDGVWVPGAATTFTIGSVSIQSASGITRVVGGRDFNADEQGEYVTDVRVLYTAVELRTRTPAFEPDQVLYEGGTWTVIRVEQWALNDDVTYRSLITRETHGGS